MEILPCKHCGEYPKLVVVTWGGNPFAKYICWNEDCKKENIKQQAVKKWNEDNQTEDV